VNDNGPIRTGPSCFSCVYFYITHESAHPYGCRTMGFKSAQLPPIAVHTSSGLACQSFVPKSKKTGQ
jgi:hypothetical protein